MRRLFGFLFILLVVVVVGVAAAGFSRGWFQVSTGGEENSAKFKVDTKKIAEDKDKIRDKARELKGKAEKKVPSEPRAPAEGNPR
jgi:hypothetical protein